VKSENQRGGSPDAAEHLSIVVVGHVDHGKSTLLGRLYADTGSLPEGKLERVQAICRQQGKEFEYAFLFDAFLEEQEQGITIDTARTFFGWEGRQYVIIDAPGHKEFLKNMISGAARAEAALLVIDALEGVREQSKKHGYLLSLLGVRQVRVVVNKMDLVAYDRAVFDSVVDEYGAFLASLSVRPHGFIPVSAKLGDNVAASSALMPWYSGPTVLDALGTFNKEAPADLKPLRFPVQDVYKFDARRIIAGRVAAGRIAVGDRLVFSPSNKMARVRSIEGFAVDPPITWSGAGRSLGVTLDEQIFVERGEVASHAESPPLVSTAFRCNLFSMGQRPLETGRPYTLRLSTQEVTCEIAAIHRLVDAGDLDARTESSAVGRNEVAELTIRTRDPLAFDRYRDFQVTGRFVLVDGHDVCAGGIITDLLADEHASLREASRRRELTWARGQVSPDRRAERYGHRAALVLIAGPDARAQASSLERDLAEDGRHAYLLNTQNLSADVGATPERRLEEAARFLADAGSIVVCAPGAIDAEALRVALHPVPVLEVRPRDSDGDSVAPHVIFVEGDADSCAEQIRAALRALAVLTSPAELEHLPARPNYSI
jgi:bifunctional enzyme CysN/CysC